MYNQNMQINMEIKDWLNRQKITDEVIEKFSVSSNEDGQIVFPVLNEHGIFIFNKYRRSPFSDNGPKYTYDRGGKVTLYGADKINEHKKILITEGEKDCLVAWSLNIPAVTSTGGAQSFQEEWVSLFQDKEVTICLDNDLAGAQGTVKILNYLPDAKIVFLPDRPGIKDISDYVTQGGDFNELIKTAIHFNSIEAVKEDECKRRSLYQSTFFHEEYIKKHTKVIPEKVKRPTYDNDRVTNAKLYPMENLLEFTRKKAVCPFHNEKTGSFYLNKDTNTGYCFGQCGQIYDVISVYMKLHDCNFTTAVNELNKLS